MRGAGRRPGGTRAARTRRRSSRRRTTAAPACPARRAAPGAPRRRSASRTACRTRSARSPGATATGRAGSSARTRPRRRGRPSRARGPARSSRVDGGRRRSSTAPDRRTGCGSRRRARRDSGPGGASSTRSSGAALGTYVVSAPRARANSRTPFTELWLSKVRRKRSPARNGYASPTSRSAPVAFGVKMATYSSGIRPEEPEHGVARALDELRHRRRRRVDGVGVAEDARPQQLEMLRQLRLRVEPGAGVVEVDVAGGVEPREVGGAELVEHRGGGVAGMLPAERLLRRVRCCERRHPLLSWPRLRPNARGSVSLRMATADARSTMKAMANETVFTRYPGNPVVTAAAVPRANSIHNSAIVKRGRRRLRRCLPRGRDQHGLHAPRRLQQGRHRLGHRPGAADDGERRSRTSS